MTGKHGTARNHDGRDVEARSSHQETRHVLVAGGDEHQTVKGVGCCHGFRAVADEFTGNEGILHADVAHGQTVADGNGGEHDGNASAERHALLDGVDDFVEVHVPGHDVVLRADDADQGFADFSIAKTECFQKAALRGGIDAFGKRITSHGYPFFFLSTAACGGRGRSAMTINCAGGANESAGSSTPRFFDFIAESLIFEISKIA